MKPALVPVPSPMPAQIRTMLSIRACSVFLKYSWIRSDLYTYRSCHSARCAQHRLWSGSRRRADNFRLYCNLWGLGFYLHRSCHVLLRIQHNHRLGLIRFPLYRIFRRRKARPSLPCSLFLCIDHRCNNQLLGLLWDIADTFNGLMAIPNLIALLILSGQVKKLAIDVDQAEKSGTL